MKKIYLIIAAVIFTAFNVHVAHAKIWRVNNKSNYNGTSLYGDNFGGTASYPVFAQVNQAVGWAGVNNNDTVYVEGSTTVYGAASLTKKLTLIGTGFFLTENPKTTNDQMESKINQVAFNVEGCRVIAMNIVNNGNSADGKVYVNTNGCIIKRCRIERGVQFATSLTDVYILENFFPNTIVTNAIFTNGNSAFIPPTNIV